MNTEDLRSFGVSTGATAIRSECEIALQKVTRNDDPIMVARKAKTAFGYRATSYVLARMRVLPKSHQEPNLQFWIDVAAFLEEWRNGSIDSSSAVSDSGRVRIGAVFAG